MVCSSGHGEVKTVGGPEFLPLVLEAVRPILYALRVRRYIHPAVNWDAEFVEYCKFALSWD